jgi:hypothetical protein
MFPIPRASRSRSLTQLACRPRQLHIGKARGLGKRSLSMSHVHEIVGTSFNTICHCLEKFCDLFSRHGSHFDESGIGCCQ